MECTFRQYRNDYSAKAEQAVSLVLGTIAPLQEESLWQAIIQCHHALNSSKNAQPPDVGLEAILLAYKECQNKSTKMQILSYCHKYKNSSLESPYGR